MNIIYIIILLLNILTVLTQTITKTFYETFYLFLSMGKPEDYSMFLVDISADINIATLGYSRERKSTTANLLGNEVINFRDREIILPKYNDSIVVENAIVLSSFLFYFAEKEPFCLGFAHKFENPNFSILHLLKQNNYINKIALTLGPVYDEAEEGTLYFGEVPDVLVNKRFNSSCKINLNSKFWECYIQYAYINNSSWHGYTINKFSIFETKFQKIYVPLKFFKWLEKNAFHDAIKKNACQTIESGGQKSIECSCKEIGLVQPISFVIDDYIFKFSGFGLFDNIFYHKCTSFFVAKLDSQENEDEFIIGSGFIKKFHTTFDYDEGRIVFYDINEFMKRDFDFPHVYFKQTQLFLLIFIILILILSSVNNAYTLFFQKN